jgi:TonB family protein
MTSILLLLVSLATPQPTPLRIETAEALSNILHRVEPTVPPEAQAAKAGGAVIMDVVIDTKGLVTSGTVLGGPDVLHGAATAAVKQWRFKPFQRGGRAISVRVILEVTFPDPVLEQRQRIYDEHRAAERECEKFTKTDPERAVPVCLDAVRRSELLPAVRVLERAHTASLYALSLAGAARFGDAVGEMERVIALRRKVVGERPDPGMADAYQVIGLLHDRSGDPRRADEAYGKAIAIYEEAIAASTQMAPLYSQRYRSALQAYAAVKRRAGDAAGAAALDSRAAALPSDVEPKPPAISRRSVDGLELVEQEDGVLSAADIAAIRTALARQRLRAWRLSHRGPIEAPSGRPDWFVEAFLEPTEATAKFRKGEVEFVVRTGGSWAVQPLAAFYVQFGSDPPIKVQAAPNRPPPTGDEIAAVVQFVYAQGDVKPWPLDFISFFDGGASATLQDPEAERMQRVSLRREGTGWRVSDIR